MSNFVLAAGHTASGKILDVELLQILMRVIAQEKFRNLLRKN